MGLLSPGHTPADTVEILRGANKDLPIGDGRGAQAKTFQLVLGQDLELRSGFDHGRQTILVGDVEFAVGEHRRGAVGSGFEALSPVYLLTGLGV